MSEVKKIATRQSYGEALKEYAEAYPNLVVLDADLAGATKTGIFKAAYPDRFYDCGIAEGNMMAIAAGLSTTGLIPFASTFAMFAAGRAYEQVRNSIGYPHLNVKIGATHAGISVGEDGASHQCLEDLALMREIPGMVVMNPADDVEARAAVKAALDYVGPVYIRFGRMAVPVINDESYKKSFRIGKGQVVKEGRDLTIFATGIEVAAAIDAAKALANDGIDAELNVYSAGTAWIKFHGIFCAGQNAGFVTRIFNGRNTSATKPDTFELITGGTFSTGSWIKVWGSNNS